MASDMTTLPAEFQDQMVAITIGLRITSQIQLLLSFPTRLDADRLARAARLLVQAEPVLGCRFEVSGDTPLWRPRSDPDAVAWFELHEIATLADAPAATMHEDEPLDGRNLVVRLLRLPTHDAVCIGVSHAVADGSAAMECAYQLAALYTVLGTDPAFRPEPNTAPRDNFEWLRSFRLRHHLRTLARDLSGLRHLRARPMGVVSDGSMQAWMGLPRTSPGVVERRIMPDRLAAIDRHATAHASTRLAVLVAGLARAFAGFTWAPDAALFRLMLPSNLRRFAPGTRRPAIRNMSIVASMIFDPACAQPFAATRQAATAAATSLERGMAGALNPIAIAVMRRMSFPAKQRLLEGVVRKSLGRPAPPTFTNVGRLHEARTRFDGVAPDHAVITAGAFPLPLVLVTGLEYRRTLTLSVGFQQDSVSRARMQRFLDAIVDEIPA